MKSKNKFVGAVVQIGQYSNKEAALRRIEELLGECAELNAKLVCLQPYVLTGYTSRQSAENIPGPSTERLAEKCKAHSFYLAAGSMVEKSGTNYYSTVPLIAPSGKVMAKYRSLKIRNYGPKSELDAGLTEGNEVSVVETEIGNIGLTQAGVGHLLGAVLRIRGCEVVVSIEGCMAEDNDAFRFCSRESAYFGNFYVLATNPWGKIKDPSGKEHLFLGGSRIISPRGEILANVGEYGEGIALASVDPELARELQKKTKARREASKVFQLSLDLLSESKHK